MTDDAAPAFLRRRYDDDEQAARAAARDGAARWLLDDFPGCGPAVIDSRGEHVVHDEGSPSVAQAAHIARHDPARALAEVGARRRALAHLLAERHLVVDGDGWYSCGAATDERDGGHCLDEGRRGDCDCGLEDRVRLHLGLLALPYADHPDYRPEWAPGAAPQSP